MTVNTEQKNYWSYWVRQYILLLSFSFMKCVAWSRDWEWSMSKFPCSLTRNMTSHSMENLTFHSLLRWKVIILQILATSLIQSPVISAPALRERETSAPWKWKSWTRGDQREEHRVLPAFKTAPPSRRIEVVSCPSAYYLANQSKRGACVYKGSLPTGSTLLFLGKQRAGKNWGEL